MKVLHFTNRFWPAIGGIESVVNNLCIELNKKGIQSDVVTLDTADGKKLKRFEKKGKTSIYRVPFADLKYYKLSSLPLGLIKQYDILHVHSIGFFCDALLLTKPIHKKKIVISTHGGIFHTKNISALKKLYFGTWERLLFRNADLIIADSDQDKEVFGKISKKIVRIDNGFSAPEPKGKKEKNSFLCVGRLSKNKNIERLIDVFAELQKMGVGYKLRIAGKDFDNLTPALKEKIKALGMGKKVELLGEVSEKELHNLYSKSEYFVSASKYEGFGISVIEAMHFRCVTILNNIPTFREFAAKGRGNIVDFEGKGAADKIARIISAKDKAQVSKAKTYSKGFLWENKAAEFLSNYGSVR